MFYLLHLGSVLNFFGETLPSFLPPILCILAVSFSRKIVVTLRF